jgi:hypothetical protein
VRAVEAQLRRHEGANCFHDGANVLCAAQTTS